MIRRRFWAVVLIILAALVGYFVYTTQKNPTSNFRFKLGLDLDGGTELATSRICQKLPQLSRTFQAQ